MVSPDVPDDDDVIVVDDVIHDGPLVKYSVFEKTDLQFIVAPVSILPLWSPAHRIEIPWVRDERWVNKASDVMMKVNNWRSADYADCYYSPAEKDLVSSIELVYYFPMN